MTLTWTWYRAFGYKRGARLRRIAVPVGHLTVTIRAVSYQHALALVEARFAKKRSEYEKLVDILTDKVMGNV